MAELDNDVQVAINCAKIENVIYALAYVTEDVGIQLENFKTVVKTVSNTLEKDKNFKKAWRIELAKASNWAKDSHVDEYTAWSKAEAAPLEEQIDMMIKYCKSGD